MLIRGECKKCDEIAFSGIGVKCLLQLLKVNRFAFDTADGIVSERRAAHLIY